MLLIKGKISNLNYYLSHLYIRVEDHFRELDEYQMKNQSLMMKITLMDDMQDEINKIEER